MGGSVAPALTNPVTHVVGISLPQQEAVAGPDGGRVLRPASVAPEAVLRAVAQQQRGGGTAVATLHLGLGSGNVRLVSDSWVHACLGRAEGGAAGLPPEDGFPLAPTDPGSLQAWPWQLYPAEPATSHRGQAGRPHGAGATAGSPPVSYPAGPAGRRRGTAANATRTAASRRRAPARPAAAAGAAAAAKEEAASSLKQEASEGSAEEAQAAPGQRFGRFGRRSGAATRRGGTAVRAASREAPAPAAAAAPAPPAVDSVPAHGGMVPEPQEPEGPGASSLQQEQAATPAPTYQGGHSLSIFDAVFGGGGSAVPAAAAPAAPPAAVPSALAEVPAPPPAPAPPSPPAQPPPAPSAPGAAAQPGDGTSQPAAAATPMDVAPGAAAPSRPRGSLRDRVARLAGGGQQR